MLTSLFIIATIVLIGLVLTWLHLKQKNEVWAQVAQDLGLNHHVMAAFKMGTITGEVAEGLRVQVETFNKDSGKSGTTYTRISTYARRALPVGLHIYRETPVWSKVEKFFGGQDFLTGDKLFDDIFIIKGAREEDILAILTPSIRSMLLLHQERFGEVDLDSHRLSFTEQGTTGDGEKIKAILRSQNEIVAAIEHTHQHETKG